MQQHEYTACSQLHMQPTTHAANYTCSQLYAANYTCSNMNIHMQPTIRSQLHMQQPEYTHAANYTCMQPPEYTACSQLHMQQPEYTHAANYTCSNMNANYTGPRLSPSFFYAAKLYIHSSFKWHRIVFTKTPNNM